MANRKKNLSGTGKEILDTLCDRAEVERSFALKLALARGISEGGYNPGIEKDDKQKWTIPEGIIKDKEFLLFKHLIIQEQLKPLDDEQISDYMLMYIEMGLRSFQTLMINQNSLEDFRIKML